MPRGPGAGCSARTRVYEPAEPVQIGGGAFPPPTDLRADSRSWDFLSAWFIQVSVASSDVRMVRGLVTFRRLA